MRKTSTLFVALTVAAASLTSCSRATYSFTNQAHAYEYAEQAPAVSTPPAVAEVLVKATKAFDEGVVPAAPTVVRAAPAQVNLARPSLTQRVVLRKLNKQLQKAVVSHQNTVRTQHTASKVGQNAILALIGLVILVIGGLTSIDFLLTFGTVFFLVSLVLLIVHLIKGD